MLQINTEITAESLSDKIKNMWTLSGQKINAIEASSEARSGTPVFTIDGKYAAQGWTEWTQGFQYGSAILQFDATGDEQFLTLGKEKTISEMTSHVTHFGVHDHGFNNVSTYGNLRRLMNEDIIPENNWERAYYEMALKCSGSVQAKRWTKIHDGTGYTYSFNGPHSLFADTIRSMRSLSIAHTLGHASMDEHDEVISLLDRMVQHAYNTARYIVFYGEGRDTYDVRGRVVHEAIFNLNDGNFRCPSSQQGFSPFTTWTRGLAWVMCGYPEQLEYLATCSDESLAALKPLSSRKAIETMMLKAATSACDFYIENTPTDGIPYWDTGALNLHKLGDYLDRPAEPENNFEPVDASAAAIGCQGLIRLGHYLTNHKKDQAGEKYTQAGLTVLSRLLESPYLSSDQDHQGLLLHSVYHQPNGWDKIQSGRKVPSDESSMWGDYHLREAALLAQRLGQNKPYYQFFN